MTKMKLLRQTYVEYAAKLNKIKKNRITSDKRRRMFSNGAAISGR